MISFCNNSFNLKNILYIIIFWQLFFSMNYLKETYEFINILKNYYSLLTIRRRFLSEIFFHSKTYSGRNLIPIANRMKPEEGKRGERVQVSASKVELKGGEEATSGHVTTLDQPVCHFLLIFGSFSLLFL